MIFGSARPVTCAVMDYARRLAAAIEARRPGAVEIRTIETDAPAGFVRAITSALRAGAIAHLQFPVEGWGNSVVPGSALAAARLLARRGRIVATMHEWASLNRLRYLSMLPDLPAIDAFVFVSAAQKAAFANERLVARRLREGAKVIPIGPNVMPAAIDPAAVAAERARVLGEGEARADLVIGHFGVLYASKRPDLLLRATAALHARGFKARLLVCGDFLHDKPADRAAFFALAEALGVARWLDFRGRIDDEGALMAALAASDVFLLPYGDGLSARRSTFQAIARLATPLVSTLPERADEFDHSALMRAKVANEATILAPREADAEALAEAVLKAHARREAAIGVDLSGLWDEAALAHLALYDGLTAPASIRRPEAQASPAPASRGS